MENVNFKQEHKHHVFYKIEDLSFDKRVGIINKAKKVSTKWWVDKLDCSISFSRQRVEMSYEDIMKQFTNDCHFVIIERRGYNDPYHGEVGFVTTSGVSHYLWIYLTSEDLFIIVDEYNLEKR